jgi:hypothetical protein
MEHTSTAKNRKAYTPPTIVEYGRMEELTRGPFGGVIDSIIGRNGDGWNPFDPPSGRSN